MIELFVLVCQILLEIHKLDVVPNVFLILIVQPIGHASITVVRIHVRHLLAVSMQTVAFMIIRPIVIVVMDLWVMHSFIAYRFHRLEIKRLILALNHHVWPEVYAMYMVMLLSVIHVQMKMATIIPDVDQSVCQTVIVNSIRLV